MTLPEAVPEAAANADRPDVLLMTANFGLELMQEPYGIAVLSALLQRHGLRTSLLEPGIDALSWQDCLAIICTRQPRILGISLLFDDAIAAVTELVLAARAAVPGLHIFLGGQAVTTGHAQPIYEPLIRVCDAIVLGEAELSAPEYVRGLLEGRDWRQIHGLAYRDRERGLIVNPPARRIEDLDQVPLPDRVVLRQIMRKRPQHRSASVQAGRGCASSCSFCSYGTLTRIQDGERKLRRRSFEAIFREIEVLYHEHGVRDFHIEDESFFERDPDYNRGLVRFARMLGALPGPISFDILARIDCVDAEATAELKTAGMTRIFAGIDSVDPDDLKLYGKGYTPAAVYDGMTTLLALGYALDVDAEFRLQTGYITFNPYSELSQIRNAYNFFCEFKNTPKLIQHYLFVFSGTPLKKKIELDGLYLPHGERIGRSEIHYQFRRREVDRLFRAMLAYFDAWSPLRDGIRMIEKTVRLEAPATEAELSELVVLRRRCDRRFFDAFGHMLDHAERDGDAAGLTAIARTAVSELDDLVSPAMHHQIGTFCRRYGLGPNFVEVIRDNPLALARYKL